MPGGHSIFVVDAYTHRILSRHGLSRTPASPTTKPCAPCLKPASRARLALYNEFHALIVNVGKNWCRTREPALRRVPAETLFARGLSASLSADCISASLVQYGEPPMSATLPQIAALAGS